VERLLPRLAELNNQRPAEHIALARRRYFPVRGSRRDVLPVSCIGAGDGAGDDADDGEDPAPALAAGAAAGPAYSERFRKLFPVSERVVQELLEGRDVAMQHNISLREARVINTRQSCLVMGRSGTGKTTCCLFRLLATRRGAAAVHEEGASADGVSTPHRQLFVTKSVELLVRVRRFYDRMARAGAGEGGDDLEEAIREAEGDDGYDDADLLDADERGALAGVPASFAALEDRHFPLFLTFEKLLAMLEIAHREAARDAAWARRAQGGESAAEEETGGAEESCSVGWMEQGRTWASSNAGPTAGGRRLGLLSISDRDVWAQEAASADPADADPAGSCGGSGREVDFDRFLALYWQHMDESLRARFEPQLVWSEIQGLIKGCEEAGRAGAGGVARGGCLSLDEYSGLSERRYPSFSHSRERLYKLFENYERIKRRLRDHDAMDRIHALSALWQRLAVGAVGEERRLPLVDELYVDEVQDLAPSMMRLLLRLVRRPGGFLMVCGDTAQTIAKGSVFRFQDLTAMVYREVSGVDPDGAQLVEERLAHNYRSHNGILRLAASVIDLLYAYFPESVDRMERDHSDEDGCLPIVWKKSAFLDCLSGSEQGWTALFAGGTEEESGGIEFGAEQAILVRSEATKARVMQLEQRPGFVGTVYDAKGENPSHCPLLPSFLRVSFPTQRG
jgi:hypothetical protein